MSASRDVYANLLRDTRGLRREQSRARDGWYARLNWERKEETLFELEMLLKGFACFGNPRNHPGVRRLDAPVAHDYRDELIIVRDALSQSVDRIRALLGQRDRAYVFSRYLEMVLPEDALRSRLIKEQLSQDTPEESLFVLRNTFGAFLEMADGTLRLGRVSHRLYFALLGMITREIGRNTYFNPLVALEFRPEFDRIRNGDVLEAMHTAGEAAHQVVAVTFLSLFRALRYIDLVDQYAAQPSTARRAYVILSVFRSDVRALTRYLAKRAPDALADSFERTLMDVHVSDLGSRHDELAAEAKGLRSMRGSLENLANVLRVEVKGTFERDIPATDDVIAADELGPQLVVASAQLRATLHHAISVLCGEIQPGRGPMLLGSQEAAQIDASERLRRDVWMFQQVLRAFLAKARSTRGDTDRWAGYASFHFVKEFLEHFRAIGYQLVRQADYARLDPFLAMLDVLRDVDLLDPDKLKAAVRECEALYRFLDDLFVQICNRRELASRNFDKRSAADTLRIYLGA
ncbi:MAG: hypothetical protein AAGE52_14645 [Myxococcota bacterium]